MKAVQTDNAPKVVGPYSQAIVAGNLVFCAGQIAIDPAINDLVAGGIKEQTTQTLRNLKGVVEAAGTNMGFVVSTSVFLADMNDYKDMNEIYTAFFSSDPKPSRVTVSVVKLPRNALVEISCIACLG